MVLENRRPTCGATIYDELRAGRRDTTSYVRGDVVRRVTCGAAKFAALAFSWPMSFAYEYSIQRVTAHTFNETFTYAVDTSFE